MCVSDAFSTNWPFLNDKELIRTVRVDDYDEEVLLEDYSNCMKEKVGKMKIKLYM